jgi:hypothetical protein
MQEQNAESMLPVAELETNQLPPPSKQCLNMARFRSRVTSVYARFNIRFPGKATLKSRADGTSAWNRTVPRVNSAGAASSPRSACLYRDRHTGGAERSRRQRPCRACRLGFSKESSEVIKARPCELLHSAGAGVAMPMTCCVSERNMPEYLTMAEAGVRNVYNVLAHITAMRV